MPKEKSRIFISHLLPDEEMKKLVRSTGAGIESIEFSVQANLDRLSSHIRDYKARLEYIEAPGLILHGPFLDLNPMSFDREIQRVTWERYAQAYEAAVQLKAEKLVFHTCLYPDAYLLIGWAERVTEFYKRFLAGHDQIQIVMENVFDRRWEPLLETVEKVRADNFCLCFDVGHANCYGEEEVTLWAKNLLPCLTHVHIHDNKGDRDAHLGMGRGNIPWEEMISCLRKKESLTYTIECGSAEDVLLSVRKLRELL